MSLLRWKAFALWLLAAVFALSCVVHTHGEIREPTEADDDTAEEVEEAPPAERVEVVPAARPGYVWVKGRWSRRNNQWVWVVGHWRRVKVDSVETVWVPGHWQTIGERKYRWVPGHWARGNTVNQPPPAPDRDRPDDQVGRRHDPHEHAHPHPHNPGEHHHHEHVHPHQPGDHHHHPF